MGRINAFLENKDEALKSFDEAIKLGDVRGGAYVRHWKAKQINATVIWFRNPVLSVITLTAFASVNADPTDVPF